MSNHLEGRGSLYSAAGDRRLGGLRDIYSRFHPKPPDADPLFRSVDADAKFAKRESHDGTAIEQTETCRSVTRIVNLDAHELFSQLCISANLVKIGPRRGVFLSVLRKTTPRIWRQWLDEQTESSGAVEVGLIDLSNQGACERIIWVDSSKNVGIRVQVQEQKWQRSLPVLMHTDEDQAVSYSLQLEGK